MTTKAEVVDNLAKELDTTKVNVNLFMDAYEKQIMGSLKKGNEVPLLGIGMLKIAQTKARSQKVPSGTIVKIPAKKVIRLSVRSEAKAVVNGKSAAAQPKTAGAAAPAKAAVPAKAAQAKAAAPAKKVIGQPAAG